MNKLITHNYKLNFTDICFAKIKSLHFSKIIISGVLASTWPIMSSAEIFTTGEANICINDTIIVTTPFERNLCITDNSTILNVSRNLSVGGDLISEVDLGDGTLSITNGSTLDLGSSQGNILDGGTVQVTGQNSTWKLGSLITLFNNQQGLQSDLEIDNGGNVVTSSAFMESGSGISVDNGSTFSVTEPNSLFIMMGQLNISNNSKFNAGLLSIGDTDLLLSELEVNSGSEVNISREIAVGSAPSTRTGFGVDGSLTLNDDSTLTTKIMRVGRFEAKGILDLNDSSKMNLNLLELGDSESTGTPSIINFLNLTTTLISSESNQNSLSVYGNSKLVVAADTTLGTPGRIIIGKGFMDINGDRNQDPTMNASVTTDLFQMTSPTSEGIIRNFGSLSATDLFVHKGLLQIGETSIISDFSDPILKPRSLLETVNGSIGVDAEVRVLAESLWRNTGGDILNSGRISLLNGQTFADNVRIGTSNTSADLAASIFVRGGVGELETKLGGSIFVSDAGDGFLEVSAGGKVRTTFLEVGSRNGSTGIVHLNGGSGTVSSEIILEGLFQNSIAAFLSIGSAGKGTVNVFNGGKITIDPGSSVPSQLAPPGFSLGGHLRNQGRGEGELFVSGGSTVEIKGNFAFQSIGGFGGKGLLDIRNGGKVLADNLDGNASAFIGSHAGGEGIVNVVDPDSKWNAGNFLGVGVDFSLGVNAGKANLFIRNGGFVSAKTTLIGSLGTVAITNGAIDGNVINAGGDFIVDNNSFALISGNFTQGSGNTFINGTLTLDQGQGLADIQGGVLTAAGNIDANVVIGSNAMFKPGNSPGILTIDGDFTLDGGTLEIEIASDTIFDILNITGDAIFSLGSKINLNFLDGYTPTSEDTFDFFLIDGLLTGFDTVDFEIFGLGDGVSGNLNFTGGGLQFISAAPVPVPAAVWLFGSALLGLVNIRRKKVA